MFEISKRYFSLLGICLVCFCGYFFYSLDVGFLGLLPIIFGSLFLSNRTYLKQYFSQEKYFDKRVFVFFLLIGGLFVLSFHFYDFFIYLSICVFLFLPLGNYIFFSIGLGLFFLSNILTTFGIVGGNECLIFSFYFFLLGLIDLPREKYQDMLSEITKKVNVENIFLSVVIIIFCLSLYFSLIRNSILEIYFIISFLYSYVPSDKTKSTKNFSPKDILLGHIFIYSLFIIIFIPIIDIYLKGDTIPYVFAILFLLFTIGVVGLNRHYKNKKKR